MKLDSRDSGSFKKDSYMLDRIQNENDRLENVGNQSPNYVHDFHGFKITKAHVVIFETILRICIVISLLRWTHII